MQLRASMRFPRLGPPHRAREASDADATEAQLIIQLRGGDETAFTELVERHHAPMLRLARTFVASDDVAAEVVQETWIAVFTGVENFEGRSTIRTWMYRILSNRAKTRGMRERRSVPFSSLNAQDDVPSVPPERFQSDEGADPDHWAMPPRHWQEPERRLLSLELRAEIARTIAGLPHGQRLVLSLHDVDGLATGEICALLGLTAGNARVLLHRARSRVRADLESYLDTEES